MAPTLDAGHVVAVNGIANVQSRMSDDCDGGSSSQKGNNGASRGDDAVLATPPVSRHWGHAPRAHVGNHGNADTAGTSSP